MNKFNEKVNEILNEGQKPKDGDFIIANDGDRDFVGEIQYIEDGLIYFEVGDDVYYSDLKTAKKEGKHKKSDLWRVEDYDG